MRFSAVRSRFCRAVCGALLLFVPSSLCAGVSEQGAFRLVIADQDAAGPGGSDMAALLVLLQSPKVRLLGITVVTGDGWRDVEVAHALRLLEIVGRKDVPVYPGAAFPLVRTQEATRLSQQIDGRIRYMGAWGDDEKRPWDQVPPLIEGDPSIKAAEEDAAHFMIRTVHQYPHQVTIFAAGPMTNVALAIRLDPHFAELAKELVFMGASLNPHTEDKEWVNTPRREFNFWFDPEAASIVLHANWAKITGTTIDASLETRLNPVLASLKHAKTAAAKYLIRYAHEDSSSDIAWDELAAASWLDPAIVKKERLVYMDANLSRGPGYGDVLTWSAEDKPLLPVGEVHAQIEVDATRLQKDLAELFSSPTPGAALTDPVR